MKKILILFLIFVILFSPNLLAEKVRYVIDGDTIILSNNERVRLLGINAPEIKHRDKAGQFYGEEAKYFLEKLVKGKEVELKGDPGQLEFDQFGRKLAYVYLTDGTFINEKLVKEGYAEVFRKYDFKYKEKFLNYEQAAKDKKIGMFRPAPYGAERNPVPYDAGWWDNYKEQWRKFWLDFLKELDKFDRSLKN